MIKNILYLFLALIFLCKVCYAIPATDEFKGVWAGVEVMGCDQKTAQLIRNQIPIKKGSPFQPNADQFKLWCNNVKEKLKTQDVQCAFIGFLEGDYYYNVEITPDDKKTTNFRVLPKLIHNIPKIPKDLELLLAQWDEIFMSMIKTGVNPHEIYRNGYLDYEDPTLHGLAVKLSNSCYKYNDDILKIIRFSPEVEQRRKAANLLSWTKHPNNIRYILKWDLLNDPDEGVRNDLARSLSFTFVDIKDKKILNESICTFCQQARLPSHTDRNKALSSLHNILNEHQELNLASNISQECIETLKYINHMSILPNAGGLAKDILDKIEQSKND